MGAAKAVQQGKDTNLTEWSAEQLRALGEAYKSFEKHRRWELIANEVEGRTMNECVSKYKEVLAEISPLITDVTLRKSLLDGFEEAAYRIENNIVIEPEKSVTQLMEELPKIEGLKEKK